MRKIILIITTCLSLFVSSCTDDSLPNGNTEESKGNKRTISFNLSKGDDNNFDVITKANGIPVPDNYAVKFYLFKRFQKANSNENEYKLVVEDNVTTPLYTITVDDDMERYKYIFLASSKDISTLKAVDFSSVSMNSGDGSIIIPKTDAGTNSLLENCYISFFDDKKNNKPSYGTPMDPAIEEIEVTKDFDIFGYGHTIQPGITNYTPIDVVMERQFGIVEFVYNNAQIGDKLICSFSSEYYRLYLSQIVKDDNTNNYTSDNYAKFPAGIFTEGGFHIDYETGDYYSASGAFVSLHNILPLFKKTSEVTSAGRSSIQVYMPYTTAEAVGSSVDYTHQANYTRTTLGQNDYGGVEITPGLKGQITLEIERGGRIVERYTSEATFPIYRNGKTIFTASGDDQLKVSFSEENNTDSGINLPDDKWNGEN